MSEDNQLGSLLIARGLLTSEQLDAALEEQERTHRSLGRILIDGGQVSEAGLVSTLATQLGLEYVDVADYPVDTSATTLISDALARRYLALPIGWQDGRLVVAMADPQQRVRDRRHPHHHRRRRAHGRLDAGVDHRRHRQVPPPRHRRRVDHGPGVEHVRGRERPLDRPRGHRGRPDRQAGQPAHHPGGRRPGLRHPHRAGRARPPGPLPHRRRAPRGDATPEEHPVGDHQPAQDHGRHQHRRAPHPPGRPDQRHDRRAATSTCGWPRCPPSTARRSSCGSSTSRRRCCVSTTSGSSPTNMGALRAVLPQAVRHHPGHRARPARASRPPCTPPSTSSTTSPRTSSPSRTRSSTGCRASTRSRSTPRPA